MTVTGRAAWLRSEGSIGRLVFIGIRRLLSVFASELCLNFVVEIAVALSNSGPNVFNVFRNVSLLPYLNIN